MNRPIIYYIQVRSIQIEANWGIVLAAWKMCTSRYTTCNNMYLLIPRSRSILHISSAFLFSSDLSLPQMVVSYFINFSLGNRKGFYVNNSSSMSYGRYHIPPSDIYHLTPILGILQLALFYSNLGISRSHLFIQQIIFRCLQMETCFVECSMPYCEWRLRLVWGSTILSIGIKPLMLTISIKIQSKWLLAILDRKVFLLCRLMNLKSTAGFKREKNLQWDRIHIYPISPFLTSVISFYIPQVN